MAEMNFEALPFAKISTGDSACLRVRVHFCVRALAFACFSVAGALVILLVIKIVCSYG